MDYPIPFYERLNHQVKCGICPHHCLISEGKYGICRVRTVREQVPVAINYGQVTSSAIDPIEKKPLYHFFPGTQLLSLGSCGCNMTCQFCQNFEISQMQPRSEFVSLRQLDDWLERIPDNVGVAFTYNEPLMWYEYVYDACRMIKEKHPTKKTVIVTNGYLEEEPLKQLLPYVDAMNIDLKGYSERYYRQICGAKLDPVLETIKRVSDYCHLEITTLLVSGENDSLREVEAISKFIQTLNPDIPLHLSRYFPRYQLNHNPTDLDFLQQALVVAKQSLNYVYLGNVSGIDQNTYCHTCHQLLISRTNGQVIRHLTQPYCSTCHTPIPIVL